MRSSGDTLVVGGLIDRSEEEVIRKVPVLSSIPILGKAFTHQALDNAESELIVFVTPSILQEPTEAQLASAEMGEWQPGMTGQAPFEAREQEGSVSRRDTIEDALDRLEMPDEE